MGSNIEYMGTMKHRVTRQAQSILSHLYSLSSRQQQVTTVKVSEPFLREDAAERKKLGTRGRM